MNLACGVRSLRSGLLCLFGSPLVSNCPNSRLHHGQMATDLYQSRKGVNSRKASSFPACLAAVAPNVRDGVNRVAGLRTLREAEEAMRRIDIVSELVVLLVLTIS